MKRWHLAVALLFAIGTLALATSARQRLPNAHHVARYAAWPGGSVRYVRAGRGRTVVLIHGYGESLVAWRGVFDVLAREYDVIALDLPGFGLSSKPAGGYTPDSIAAHVLEALRSIGVRRAVLVGHSLGGAVSSAAALTDSALVEELVLLDPAVVGAPMVVPSDSGARPGVARRTIAEYEALRTRFTAPHDPQWLAESDSALAYLPAEDSAYRVSAAAVLTQFDFGYLTPERAGRLRQPTLILWGEYDPVLPIASGRALAALLPNAEFEVISRSWHRPHVERPAETAQAIRRFLARHAR